MTAEDLHRRSLRELEERRDGARRVAAGHRVLQAEAKEAGDASIARNLGMLAAHMEQKAALAEAERRDRIARHDKLQGGQKARAASKAARAGQAAQAEALLAELFAATWRAGMRRVRLAAAALAELAERDQRLRDRLATAMEVGNRPETRRLQSQVAALERQRALCTAHRAGKWLQQHGPPP
jgi:hypothetical protein